VAAAVFTVGVDGRVPPAVDGDNPGRTNRRVDGVIMERSLVSWTYDFLTNRFTVGHSSHAKQILSGFIAMAKSIIPRIHMG